LIRRAGGADVAAFAAGWAIAGGWSWQNSATASDAHEAAGGVIRHAAHNRTDRRDRYRRAAVPDWMARTDAAYDATRRRAMRDDAAFLRAIIDNPDDDLPRLVYADWLDEHGEPARAEFIRVQCELARLTWHDPPAERLRQRQRELLAEHETRWTGPLAEFVAGFEFRRGFIENVSLGAGAFLRHGESLWRSAPVRGVRLTNAWEEIDKLAAAPHLGRVRSLLLSGNYLGTEEAVTLLESPHLTQLEELDLSTNHLRAAAVEALARSPRLVGLRVLDLTGNDVGSEGVAALAASPFLYGLEILRLRSAGVGPAGVEALAGGALPGLTALDLSGNLIGSRGLRSLLHAAGRARLRRLDLREMIVDPTLQADLRLRFGPGVCLFD
jgi:uncharacterized protein (TIGR02996 family)